MSKPKSEPAAPEKPATPPKEPPKLPQAGGAYIRDEAGKLTPAQEARSAEGATGTKQEGR